MTAIRDWHMTGHRIAINDTRALTAFMSQRGYVDVPVSRVLRRNFPYRFELPGRLTGATWTMWKMIASGQINGEWTFTAADDDSYIAFYFKNATDCAYARMISGDDDKPADGWVPEDLFEVDA